MSADDPYVYPGTDVLRNRFDIRTDTQLAIREQAWSARALVEMSEAPVTGSFDLTHYRDIHRRLFDRVYDWAGQVRTIDLTKPEIALQGQSVQYSPVARIEADATRAVGLMAGPWGDLKNRPEAARFAVVVAELWRAHPFREGNTRTVLAFVEQFARARDITLDMAVINRVPSETRDALALATTGHIAPLVRLIVEARRSELQRAHPELGRLSSEAVEVMRLLGNPRIVVPAIGAVVQGRVMTTSYDHVLIRRGAEIAAVPLRAFPTPPLNDASLSVTVLAPGIRPDPVLTPSQVPQRVPDAVLAAQPAPVPLDASPSAAVEIPAPAPLRAPDAVLAAQPAPVPLDASPSAAVEIPAPAPLRAPDAVLAVQPAPVPLDASPSAAVEIPAPAPLRAPDAVLAAQPAPVPLDASPSAAVEIPAPAPQRAPDPALAERPAPAPLQAPAPARREAAAGLAQPGILIPIRPHRPIAPDAIEAFLAGNSIAGQARTAALTVTASVFMAPDTIVQTFERQIARGATVDPAVFASEPLRGKVTWHGPDRERTAALKQLPGALDTLRRLEAALRAAMATQRADLDRLAQRDQIPIPAPSPRLADALAAGTVRAILDTPDLMTEVKGLTDALHARFSQEGTAVLTIGRPADAAALLPEGQTVETIRAVLEPMRAVIAAEQEQARTLTRDKTLAPEAPALGAAR